ncbi:MAG: PD-(D/E)XK nuclease family protein, partial [Oceanococcaceae bacterium]
MALRALLSNPLMPWSPDEGRYMANTLLDYGFSIKRPRGLAGTHEAILKAFETSHAVDHIPEILTSLVQTLRDEDGTERHRHRAVELVEQVCAAIRSGTRDLKELLKRIPVMPIATERERDVTQEGVTVYVEDEMPLRPVRYLFVLDFNDGHFPRVPTLSPVFSVDDWRRLRDGGLPLTLPAETAEWSRANFRRQLSHVSDQLVVLIPRFSPVGDRLHPSVSLMDFMCLSGGKEDPDEIVLDLDRPDDRRQLTWLAIAESAPATMPRELSVGDLSLKRNLLADSRASLEKPRTLSPSRLEGLLVSPLAWLLESMDALPRQWEPDRFDALTSGSIAHGVFEVLFPAGTTGVSSAEIDDRIADVFDAAIRKVAPALVAAEWAIERDNLLGTVRKAAMRWAQMLEELGAEVVQAEMKLAGHMDGLALSGAADAVIRLPNGALAVVDYKTASAKKYLQQMESGWDLQTALYSRMLENGGPKDPELRALLTGLDARSVTYYTLRDMAACANYQPSTGIRGWRFAGVDTSGQAMSALGERFRELRAGQVLMPRASVLKTLEKAGIGDYALRASPMTAVTMDDTGSAA